MSTRSKSGTVNLRIEWDDGKNTVDSAEVTETVREALRLATGDPDVNVKVQSAVIVQEDTEDTDDAVAPVMPVAIPDDLWYWEQESPVPGGSW